MAEKKEEKDIQLEASYVENGVVEAEETVELTQEELKAKLQEKAKEFEEGLKKDAEYDYKINFKDRKTVEDIADYLHKEIIWDFKTLTGINLLYKNIKAQKAWYQSKEFDGVLTLKSLPTLVLYNLLKTGLMGRGIKNADVLVEKFQKWTSNLTESIDEALKTISERRQALRQLSQEMEEIERDLEGKIVLEGKQVEEYTDDSADSEEKGTEVKE